MSTVLQLRFPGRRYHATPWGHHVNEGAVEWPPSPWRLLRALLATGFAKHGWSPDAPPATARTLFEALAASTPRFFLPPATLAHSRHYVVADAKKPLILDAWARVDEDGPPLEVVWPVELPSAERVLFGELAASLGYLGRAESWVLGSAVEAGQGAPNCERGAVPPGPGWEPVRLMCPVDPQTYDRWRAQAVARVDAELPLPAGKKPTAKLLKDRAKALEPYPADLIAAMCCETGWLQAKGWSSPPGSEEVVYWRRRDALTVGPTAPSATERGPSSPFVLLALSTPSRRRSGLPTEARTFPQGRLLHKALAAAVDHSGARDAALVLLGRDGEEIARTNHRHAHLLHLVLGSGPDSDGRLDHALVWAPAGIDADGLRAIRAIRRTYMKGGVGELQVAVVAAGDHATLLSLDDALQGRLSSVLGPLAGAREWVSATPFVAARHTKRSGKDSLVGQVQHEAERRGLGPVEVEVLPFGSAERIAFRHHVLVDRDRSPPVPVHHVLRLRFARPVQGPVCLGWGSHCGLGRFSVAPAEPNP
jgi:CRISPR-associated protein Csb2